MRKYILTVTIFLSSIIAFAQKDIVVQSGEKGSYINHTVAAKESFFSISRTYGIHPKEIADYNSLDMEKGLNIGQVIRIPVTQSVSQGQPTGKPVYYIVGEKEGLYRVSLKNNNVLMADLRKWNDLKTDKITAGQKLIVGFIPSGDVHAKALQAEEGKPNEPEVTEQPNHIIAKKKEPAFADTKKDERVAPIQTARTATNDGSGGYFRTAYEQQSRSMKANKEQTATSGIFKTGSGWDDGKYYILIDKLEPGTIVKVSNPSNSKVVYAKVLEGMTGIRQNAGLDIRISNAAASILDITDTEKFIVKVAY